MQPKTVNLMCLETPSSEMLQFMESVAKETFDCTELENLINNCDSVDSREDFAIMLCAYFDTEISLGITNAYSSSCDTILNCTCIDLDTVSVEDEDWG